MLYIVIEHLKEGAASEIYRRLRTKGRMMPEGLDYISSWIDLELKVCWQLMQTEDLALLFTIRSFELPSSFGIWISSLSRYGSRILAVLSARPCCAAARA